MIRNYLMGIAEDALSNVLGTNKRAMGMKRARKYREGYQPKRLAVRPPLSDDNIIINFSGLVVERAVSLVFGGGVTFDLPGKNETPADVWLAKVWEVNKKEEILNDIGDYGASSGTPVVLFDSETVYNDGVFYPELSCLDPAFLEIKTDPENYKRILAYQIEYPIEIKVPEFATPQTIKRRRVIEPSYGTDKETNQIVQFWTIKKYELRGNKWVELDPVPDWEYEWPPILAWKNLPNAGSQYGRPDLTDDVLDVQDAINLVASNINKVMRLQGNQRLWGRFIGTKRGAKTQVGGTEAASSETGVDVVELGADKILNINDERGHLQAIEANSSFQDMTLFLHELRDALFSIARSTDPSSLKDKVGQITNFGLRILYKDALDKLKTKQQLYGDALKEINRRLLLLGGFDPNPGQVKWGKPLAENESEVTAGQKFELEQGLTSKQTIREERGRDNDTELKRITTEEETANASNDNVGSQLLNNFTKAQGKMKGNK